MTQVVHKTFEEWYEAEAVKSINNRTFKEFARVAWEAAWAEGLAEGYAVGYDDSGICPECLNEIRHKIDCGRQR